MHNHRSLAHPVRLAGMAAAASLLLTLSACDRSAEPTRVEPMPASPAPTAEPPVATRSDTLITGDVMTMFANDDQIRSLNLDVDTDRGVVRLSGEIDRPEQRDRALMLAGQVEGVQQVLDQMSMRR
jgi:hyperosmotically inducible periplasmic protein